MCVRGVSGGQEFGDGIMSAFDFAMVVKRLADPKGDRSLYKSD
jgi:cyanate lyase